MYGIPLRRKKPRARKNEGDLPSHRKWIRGHNCAVKGCTQGPIVCAHVRDGDYPESEKGGTGLKPHDKWSIPLCDAHHRLQTDKGEQWFDDNVLFPSCGWRMLTLAVEFWKRSPVRRTLEHSRA
jgi:hypothetical protein